jgi:hypothetical protein
VLGALALLLLLAGIVFGVLYFRNQQPAVPAYAAQSACDHPYFPLRPGATWYYTGDVSVGEENVPTEVLWLVDNVNGNESNAGAIVVIEYRYDGGTYGFRETVEFSCTSEGIIRGNSIVNAGEQSINQYSLRSGAYLLPPDKLRPGTSWDHLYAITVNYAPPSTDYAWKFTATLIEQIDNPAGSFDALRIDGSRTRSSSAEAYTSIEWFAYGIGQVRSERVQSEGGRDVVSKLELASYNVP